jgi:uncharacterized protein YjbI with pentapeptide repeats
VARERPTRFLPDMEERPPVQMTRLDEPVDLSEVVLTGDFSACHLAAPVFRQCLVAGASFIGSTLRNARFVDCTLTDSDLSGAVMEECSLSRVEFRNCRASGLQAPLGRFRDVGIFSSKIDGANFRLSSWERAEITESDLADCDFYGAKLPASRILSCDLSRVELSQADLAGSRLSGSQLEDLRGAAGLRSIIVSGDQIMPLALALFASQRIEVSDEI